MAWVPVLPGVRDGKQRGPLYVMRMGFKRKSVTPPPPSGTGGEFVPSKRVARSFIKV